MNTQPGAVPAVSIVVPLYNKGKDVIRAVASVLAQSFPDFELIVVNDGSADQGPELVRAVQDQRVRIIDQENRGVSLARNRGVQEARADLVAFLDADDEWRPTFLETIVRLRVKFPDCAVFATSYLFREATGTVRMPILRGLPAGFQEGRLVNYFAVARQSDPPLWTSAVAVEKKALVAIHGFPAGVTSGEDLLTWARLAARYGIAYSSSPLAEYFLPASRDMMAPRQPDTMDAVGTGLAALLDEIAPSKEPHLKDYLGGWHKIRAVHYLRLWEPQNALVELEKAGRFSSHSLPLQLYRMIACLPGPLAYRFMQGVYHANIWRRKRVLCQPHIKGVSKGITPMHPVASKINTCIRYVMAHTLSAVVPLYIVNEFPRSGGTWIAQMLSRALEVPFPRNRFPVLGSSVLHGHYLRPFGMKNVVVVWRDGRDVMVSWYNHCLLSKDPFSRALVDKTRRLVSFKDYDNVRQNLPAFIEYAFTRQPKPGFSWSDFVKVWYHEKDFVHVRYEDMRSDPAQQLADLVQKLVNKTLPATTIDSIVGEYSFCRLSGRNPGEEKTGSFLRKGIVGDWQNCFNQEAREIFNHYAGGCLIELGYEKDDSWVAG